MEKEAETSGKLPDTRSARCISCATGIAVQGARRLLGVEPPKSLVVEVGASTTCSGEGDSLIILDTVPSPSLTIFAYGRTYRLVSIIYHNGKNHFSCQANFRGEWWYYDDVAMNGKARHLGVFKNNPSDGA